MITTKTRDRLGSTSSTLPSLCREWDVISYQRINQSISQSTNQPTNQPTNLLGQLVPQSVCPSVCQSYKQMSILHRLLNTVLQGTCYDYARSKGYGLRPATNYHCFPYIRNTYDCISMTFHRHLQHKQTSDLVQRHQLCDSMNQV